jgi:hypothetical protein
MNHVNQGRYDAHMVNSIGARKGHINPLTFPSGESRIFSNVYLPVQKNFDESFKAHNLRTSPKSNFINLEQTGVSSLSNAVNAMAPESEAVRQTGSGTEPIMPRLISHMIVSAADLTSAANNYDIGVPAPRNALYPKSGSLAMPSEGTVINKIHGSPITPQIGVLYHNEIRSVPLLTGGAAQVHLPPGLQFSALPDVPNPAVNNWLPGTMIPEPMRTYEYSTPYQFRTKPTDPIIYHPKQSRTRDQLSYMDHTPLEMTNGLFNLHAYRKPASNPLVIAYGRP